MRAALAGIAALLIAGGATASEETWDDAGTVVVAVLPLGALGGTLAARDSQGTRQLAKSVVLAESVTYVLKYAINEERPDGDDYSFPSGHSALAFSSAEFVRRRYGNRWGLPAYAAATFVGWSRVEADRHWPHDVVAGAAIGILAALLFTEERPATDR